MHRALAPWQQLRCFTESSTTFDTLKSCANILAAAGRGASSETSGTSRRLGEHFGPSQARRISSSAPTCVAQPALQVDERNPITDGQLQQNEEGAALGHVPQEDGASRAHPHRGDGEGWEQESTARMDAISRGGMKERGRVEASGHLPEDERKFVVVSKGGNWGYTELGDANSSGPEDWATVSQNMRRTLALELGLQEPPMTGSQKLRVWRQSMEEKLQEKLWGRRQVTGKKRAQLGMADPSRRSSVAPSGQALRMTERALDSDADEDGDDWEAPSRTRSPPWTPMDDEHFREELESGIPFTARAFYVGKQLARERDALYRAANALKLPTVWSTPGSRLICLTQSWNAGPLLGKGLPPTDKYVAVFDRMESVVFFNANGQEEMIWKDITSGSLGPRHTEEYKLVVQPEMEESSRRRADYIVLREAEADVIKTVAWVLAQTVALHFYETQVDGVLAQFHQINQAMERTGSFSKGTSKEQLLRLVAGNNVMMTDIMSNIGIMNRFDVAWRDPECNTIYEHLRDEMEIKLRYKDLELKFDLIQENLKYFLEIMQNKKSDLLEWTIIVLIAGEIAVSVYDMWSRGVLTFV